MTAKPEEASSLMQNPSFLLVATGTLIGFNFPLGKISGEAGVSPMLWAMLVSIGATVMLLPVLAMQRRLILPNRRMIRYIVISGLISFVTPNLLLFTVIPHVGAGYTGLMFALSPVFTLAFAALFKQKTASRLGVIGIGLGLMGASLVSIMRITEPDAPPTVWVITTLMIPVVLAAGNIYRTMDWPENASPDVLAFWSHAFSVVVFLSLLTATHTRSDAAKLGLVPFAAMAQTFIAGLTYPVYFRLQQRGGPVLLSQIGYVSAAVGMIAATVILGERYSAMTWLGAGIIASGVVVTIKAQRNRR